VARGLPVEATPLLAPAATQALDRPGQRTAVLPPPEPERRSPWVPVAVTLILIAVLGAVLWFLASTLLDDDEPSTNVLIEVPTVIGERQKAAEDLLQEAGLTVGEITKVPAEDETQVPGTVLDQDPAAGTEVEEGTPVNLTVIAPPDAVIVPPLEGLSPDQATLALDGLGLIAVFEEEPSNTIPEGFITRTEPVSGTEVEPGSTVRVFVSAGLGTVAVPEVRCLAFNAAQNQIEKAGLNPVISSDTVDLNPLCPLGNKVAAQDPAPGTEVELGATVTLFAGEEPPPPTGATGPTGTT
jgi:serine/threonine-protein kinase